MLYLCQYLAKFYFTNYCAISCFVFLFILFFPYSSIIVCLLFAVNFTAATACYGECIVTDRRTDGRGLTISRSVSLGYTC